MFIQEIQNTNHLLHKNPLSVRAIYWIPALLNVVLLPGLIHRISVFCIFSLFLLYINKLSFYKLIRLYSIPVVFILLGCFTLLFTWKSNHPILTVGTLRIGMDDKSLSFAIQLICQSMATVSIIYFFILTHTISEVTTLMKSVRIPGIFIEIFILSYKFIENLFDTYQQILVSMQCRMAFCSRFQQWRNYSMLIAAVFQKSFNQVNKLEVSSLSRNIELFNKGIAPKKTFQTKQLIPPCILCAVLLTLMVLENYVG